MGTCKSLLLCTLEHINRAIFPVLGHCRGEGLFFHCNCTASDGLRVETLADYQRSLWGLMTVAMVMLMDSAAYLGWYIIKMFALPDQVLH